MSDDKPFVSMEEFRQLQEQLRGLARSHLTLLCEFKVLASVAAGHPPTVVNPTTIHTIKVDDCPMPKFEFEAPNKSTILGAPKKSNLILPK